MQPTDPEPVTLFCGLLSARPEVLDVAEARLADRYGPVDVRSPDIGFDFTSYYEPQMGRGLTRRFVSFARKIDPGRLAEIKRATNGLEAEAARAHAFAARPVNLAPGYLSPAKLVLASCKDRAHRIYLGLGVYAEITLRFHGGRFRPVETTYPDYRTAEYIEFFAAVRRRHMGSRGEPV